MTNKKFRSLSLSAIKSKGGQRLEVNPHRLSDSLGGDS